MGQVSHSKGMRTPGPGLPTPASTPRLAAPGGLWALPRVKPPKGTPGYEAASGGLGWGKLGAGKLEGAVPPLALFLRLSVGRKWIVGMRQTSCMGSASTKQEFFRSQPAPSRYRPRTQTPSWEDMGAG